MANESRYKMSEERRQALVEELQQLETVGMKEAAARIAEARSFGDLSENSEYDEAKNEQGKIASRIAELKDLVENAIIVAKGSEARDVVSIGTRVRVQDLEDDSEEDAADDDEQDVTTDKDASKLTSGKKRQPASPFQPPHTPGMMPRSDFPGNVLGVLFGASDTDYFYED